MTEARAGWKPDDLRRYADYVLECFGAERVLWGSDWPVMRLNADYSAWLATAKQFMELQSAAERSAIFHDNAIRFYRLPPK